MTTLDATDGVALAVHRYNEFDLSRPTVLAVHGYPDNHQIWDGVADLLVGRYNVAAYDVRGAGESSCPADRSGYRLAQLVADLETVIDSLGVERVHLLAHDWGSVQGWAAVGDDRVAPKIASFTSISGPHLNLAGRFLRSARGPRGAAQVVRQMMSSGYLGFLLCPGIPEFAFRSRIGVKVIEATERIGRTSARSRRDRSRRSLGDYVNGVNLYRQNLPGPLTSPGELPDIRAAVQVLVPANDMFITPALQRFIGAIPRGGRVIPIQGGHWVVSARPDVIARLTAEWVDRVLEGTSGAGAAVIRGGPREVRGKLALVTGAGAGIGRATAVELARRGAGTVLVVDLDLAAANESAGAVRAACAQAAVYRVDVTDDDAVSHLAARVREEHGVVDILVNSFGDGAARSLPETFGDQMAERGEGGTIINVSACRPGHRGAPGTGESLRSVLAGEGIAVTAVYSRSVDTDSAEKAAHAAAQVIVDSIRTGPGVVPIGPASRLSDAVRRVRPSLGPVSLRRHRRGRK